MVFYYNNGDAKGFLTLCVCVCVSVMEGKMLQASATLTVKMHRRNRVFTLTHLRTHVHSYMQKVK